MLCASVSCHNHRRFPLLSHAGGDHPTKRLNGLSTQNHLQADANGQVRRLCKELGIEDFEPMRGFGDYTFEFESTEVETLKYAVQDSPYCRAHE
jgi:hypothetical protein